MLGHNRLKVPSSPFEGFSGGNALSEASDEASEKFKSALIVAYEEALERGLTPACALAAMLDLVSVELKRSSREDPR
jgi:hypothetical protein